MMNATRSRSQVAGWPTCGPDTVYDYAFTVWPDEESHRWNPSCYELFRMLAGRVVLEFTERQFNDFREGVAKAGLTLREIERQPHLEPATVH